MPRPVGADRNECKPDDRNILSLWPTGGCRNWVTARYIMPPNPFDFMEMISLQGKTNFFEKEWVTIRKASVLTSTEDKASAFSWMMIFKQVSGIKQ